MATYPGGIYAGNTVADGVDDVLASDHNTQDGEIIAVETELGTDVAGSKTDLKARLAVSLADDGTLEFADSTILTITSGAITVTQNWHRVATEGGAGTDNLDTINGLGNDGAVIFIRPSTSNDIVVKHNTGNIVCVSGADITLADTNEFAVMIYDGNLTKWIAGRMAAGDEVTTSSGAADSYIAVYTASGNIEGTDDLQWNGTTLTIGDGTAGRDYILTINGENSDFVATWDEDNDYLIVSDDLILSAAKGIYFRDLAIQIASNSDGYLGIIADTEIDIKAPTVVIGSGAAGVDYALQFNGETNDGTITWMEDEDYFLFADDIVLPDNEGAKFGTGVDMSIYYDGTSGNIDTDLVAASDLTIDCGTAKTLVLEVPVYQDSNIGALVLQTGGTLPGVVQILDKDGDATGIYTRGFAVGEQGSAVMEIPHDYKEGTDLTFHVHWGANDAPSGTDQVAWQLTYAISRDDNTFPDAVTPAAGDTAYDTQYEWLRTDVATITGSTGGRDGGNIKIGDQFHFTLARVAAAGDAFAGEALVASIGFHYQVDTLGSRQIGTK